MNAHSTQERIEERTSCLAFVVFVVALTDGSGCHEGAGAHGAEGEDYGRELHDVICVE